MRNLAADKTGADRTIACLAAKPLVVSGHKVDSIEFEIVNVARTLAVSPNISDMAIDLLSRVSARW